MRKELTDRINGLDAAEPWIWKLRLSETDFTEIEESITNSIAENGGSHSHLLTPQWARIVIAYMAEWYKRRYSGGNTNDKLCLGSEELEAVWKAAGLSIKRLVYVDGNGNHRWQYSTYVLGGLAIRHELCRGDNGRFMKAVCKIYHKEKYTIENLENEERAVSFRESIQKEHSLYHYLKAILDGDMPFSVEDTNDPQSEVSVFVEAMKRANDEVMRNKFRFEWLVTNTPDVGVMRRRLRIWLKPEEVGAGLRQYLRFDRVLLWGVREPMKEKMLLVAVRFTDGSEIVGEADWENPLTIYVNTGCTETGFLAIGVSDYAICRNVPSRHFTKIEILLKDTKGKVYNIQEEAGLDYMQMWRLSEYDFQWSSIQNAQGETALLFCKPWKAVLDTPSEIIDTKPFKAEDGSKSDDWHLRYIYDKATITYGKKEVTFYNRQGYYRIMARLYGETIRYIDGGYVWHTKPNDDGRPKDELLPLIFGRDDIMVRHFGTKDDIMNAKADDEAAPEMVEYKDGAKYVEWTDSKRPRYGKVALRVTSRGKQTVVLMCYLPKISDKSPIERDFAKGEIHYMSYDERNQTETKVRECKTKRNHKPLEPTVTLRFGKWNDNIKVEVWQPTLTKEILLDGELVKYVEDGERFKLPYIFKDRVTVNDFSRKGYRQYNCKDMRSIYCQDFINIAGNPNSGVAALAAWTSGNSYLAKLLDSVAPEFISVTFGNDKTDRPGSETPFAYWDYDQKKEPLAVDFEYADEGKWGVVFQDMRNTKDFSCHYPAMNDDDVWEWDEAATSIVKCFDVANEYSIYFFEMMPLRDMRKNEYVKKLYNPLVENRNGILTESDKSGLLRFAEEFGFSWQDFGIKI